LISYKPFQKLLIDRGIKKQDLLKQAGISWGTMARLNTNQYVSLEVIDKLCTALECQPGELIEFIKDKSVEK
jgi:DNA-binding Xre family transcriptional regulator